MTLTVLAAITVAGALIGCAAAVWLDHWVRTRWPREYERIVGQDPLTREPLGTLSTRWLQDLERKAGR